MWEAGAHYTAGRTPPRLPVVKKNGGQIVQIVNQQDRPNVEVVSRGEKFSENKNTYISGKCDKVNDAHF